MKILIYLNFYDKVKVVFEGKCVVLNIILFFKRKKRLYKSNNKIFKSKSNNGNN